MPAGPELPTRIGARRVLARLGGEGRGEVVLVRDEAPGRAVAATVQA